MKNIKNTLLYRKDIDGLRALAVLAVVIFHSGIETFSGGYVGVDVFFVISGYLITSLIIRDIDAGAFSYVAFYKRRIARLLPALIITLIIILMFGFVFYDNHSFDNLGKEVFFSSLGLVNILFGQGVDYFAQDASVRPLIHFWSLGIEEQFYFVWPTILLLLSLIRAPNRGSFTLFIFILLFTYSFYLAISSSLTNPLQAYFYPQYRAFELVIGAITAHFVLTVDLVKLKSKFSNMTHELLAGFFLLLIILPIFLLNKDSTFPGVNTLFPIFGTALFIFLSENTKVSKALSKNILVNIGLISYPLYLYHQPILSYLDFFGYEGNKLLLLLIVLLIATPLAWLTYKYIEKPIRLSARKNSSAVIKYLLLGLGICTFLGIFIAKSNGFPERFYMLNNFAYQVSLNNESVFNENFTRGVDVKPVKNGKVLFIGDSLMQHYISPIAKSLNVDLNDVDVVSRGGCVMLKNVDFIDKFSDISCNSMRDSFYRSEKTYDTIVFSQDWASYSKNIKNLSTVNNNDLSLSMWVPFIKDTIKYLSNITSNIIIVGLHPVVDNTVALRPTIFSSEMHYTKNLLSLRVINSDNMVSSKLFFTQFEQAGVTVLHPIDIWKDKEEYVLHNNQLSFFVDSQHMSQEGDAFSTKRIKSILRYAN
jgi:peptidoglycan/LPS O-acetylase OafA/YrhL